MSEWLRNFRHLAVTAFLCFGALAVLLVMAGVDPRRSNLPFILFMCGAGGAVVGNYRKLSLLGGDSEAVKQALATPSVTLQLYVSPVIGGVFALLAWSAFFSGILKGALFPNITGVDAAYTNFHDLMTHTHPATFAEAMKGVFWSFVAGYSERFVPNVIDQLAQQAQKGEAPKPGG